MPDKNEPLLWGVGCDHAAVGLKQRLAGVLVDLGARIEDVGTYDETSCDYPDFAHAVAGGVASGRFARGLLVCGTGIGMSIAANRHRGVRAALCTNELMARMARAHNDANVLCLGARVIGEGLAEAILRAFVAGGFEGDRHARRVGKIEPAGGGS